eukprot:TRINITY_DN12414_c0_g1_i1.p1 TRINITY_DN12414_c0_g1~~TRINITY_DN12414_c0_g1_i1.p1  ORF type:complete len:422 (+),score=102.89 TRINITY_DN12414_c0_g1_i1:280-1545(+)
MCKMRVFCNQMLGMIIIHLLGEISHIIQRMNTTAGNEQSLKLLSINDLEETIYLSPLNSPSDQTYTTTAANGFYPTHYNDMNSFIPESPPYSNDVYMGYDANLTTGYVQNEGVLQPNAGNDNYTFAGNNEQNVCGNSGFVADAATGLDYGVVGTATANNTAFVVDHQNFMPVYNYAQGFNVGHVNKKRKLDEVDSVILSREELLRTSLKELDALVERVEKKRSLTEEEKNSLKKQRRLVRNREYAQESRKKKKMEQSNRILKVQKLEKENSNLKLEIEGLKKEITSLKEENAALKSSQSDVPLDWNMGIDNDYTDYSSNTTDMFQSGMYLLGVLLFALFLSFGDPQQHVGQLLGYKSFVAVDSSFHERSILDVDPMDAFNTHSDLFKTSTVTYYDSSEFVCPSVESLFLGDENYTQCTLSN